MLKWGYDEENGPSKWSESYPLASGSHQSPIDIITKTAFFDPKLAIIPLTFTYDDNCFKYLKNTGHSFEVSGLPDSYSIVTGGPVQHKYKFLQFHMHWGSNDNEGSEHLIDGVAYSGELHLVNWNADLYKEPSEAVKSNKHDGLIVLGVLFKVGKQNLELDKIITQLHQIPLKGQRTNLENSLDFRNLLPKNSSYWTYQGSLTTPPCTESVQWVVFQEHIELSKEQLNSLRQLYSCSEPNECCAKNRQRLNFRTVCELNDRIITKSFN